MKVQQSFLNSLVGKSNFLAKEMIKAKHPNYRIREVTGEETTDSPPVTIILYLKKEYLQVSVYVLVVVEARIGNNSDLEKDV